MYSSRITTIGLLAVTLVAGAAVLTVCLPDGVIRADIDGDKQVAGAKLQTAEDISDAFKSASKIIQPSVVSIRSVSAATSASNDSPSRVRPPIPPEFRRFFEDDDMFERFFEDRSPTPSPRYEQRGSGTGFIIRSNGFILTNNHVVRNADEITVKLNDGRRYDAEVVGTDPATDLAVLKINADNLQAARLGSSSRVEVGEWVLAIGSPFGLDQTVTAGIISAKGRANVGITDYEDFLQTDAAVNPGSSGGPLVNLKGEVIGINTAIASRSGNYNGVGFAIPSDLAQSIAVSLIDNGSVQRGYLGALIQDLNSDLAKSFNYNGENGVLIGDVVDGGPAEKSGLKSGDIIVSFNGSAALDANSLRNAVAATAPGTNVALELFRDGNMQKLSLKIGKLESDTVQVAATEKSATKSGISVKTLTPALASELGYPSNVGGVVVVNVSPDSPFAQVGLEKDDVIVAVGDQQVATAEEFSDVIYAQNLEDGVRLLVMRDGSRRYLFVRSQ